jgi:hypothetical protein
MLRIVAGRRAVRRDISQTQILSGESHAGRSEMQIVPAKSTSGPTKMQIAPDFWHLVPTISFFAKPSSVHALDLMAGPL